MIQDMKKELTKKPKMVKEKVKLGRPKATGMYLLNKAANHGKTKKQ